MPQTVHASRRTSRLRPRADFDASEQSRSGDRYRRIALSGAGAVIARGIGVLTTIVTLPLCVHHLGAERCGIWITVTSLIAVSGFADLGIGSGLTNAISAAHGRNDRHLARELVSTAVFLLAAWSAFLLVGFVAVYGWVPWAALLNATSAHTAQEAGPAMAALVLCVLANVPLGVVSRIQLGYQEAFVNSLWETMGNLLALAAVLAAVWLSAGLPWLVLATAGPPLATTALNAATLFGYRRPWLRRLVAGVACRGG